MNKLILASMLALSTFTSFVNKGSENNLKKDIVKNDNIVETIAQEYEVNSKHISYNSIKDSIYNSGIFNKLKKTITFDFGSEYEYAFGVPFGNYTSEDISFKNKWYKFTFDNSECQNFNNDFINDAYYKLEDIIGHILVVSVISDIAHYYSEHNNQKKITNSINVLKELIADINAHDHVINEHGLFMTEIQSWDLEKLIADYSNKIFSSKLDLYRNVDYNVLLDYSFRDFELELVSKSKELQNQTTIFIPSMDGNVKEDLSFDFKKNTPNSFKISATENVRLSVYHRIDLLDYGCSVTLDFYELTHLDISI